TILRHLKEWNPTVSMVAFEAGVGYLPHLRRNGEENVFYMMVGGIVTFFNGALKDGIEESIQEGLDVFWQRVMGDDLYKCLMGIVAKENVEGKTLSKAIDFILVLAENGERS
ncbi:hypothetical protein Tco_0515874, partial [Tanacetum coccineum]